MSAGLPGTGLGGLFYLLLALAMPVLKVVQSLRGDHSPERWRLALTQAGIALGIIGATVGVVVAVRVLVARRPPRGPRHGPAGAGGRAPASSRQLLPNIWRN